MASSKRKSPLLKTILKTLGDSKAEDIVTLELDGKSAIADEMVVASGRSNRHVSAIAEQLLETLKAQGLKGLGIEGKSNCDWVLVDTGDVVVHIFRPDVRVFYNLERLWSASAPAEQVTH